VDLTPEKPYPNPDPKNTLSCDVLSRYNMATAAWRVPPKETDATNASADTSTIITSSAVALPANLFTQLFDDNELQDDRHSTSWHSLPPIVFHGNPAWKRASKHSDAADSHQRVIVVTGAATVPIDHALELLGATGTVIRFDNDIPSKFSSHLHLSNQSEFFDNLHHVPPFSARIDWFVAVYTEQPLANGAPDPQLNSWVDQSARLLRRSFPERRLETLH
jgi:hypothetical protein